MLAAVAAGGAVGSLCRYALSVALPHDPGAFPASTLIANVTGCLLIGALMAIITEAAAPPHRLLRPFLGIGVLGGFTTFSTYVVDVIDTGSAGNVTVAVGYGLGTVAAALVAVVIGLVLTRAVIRHRGGEPW